MRKIIVMLFFISYSIYGENIDYRAEMRAFVIGISNYAKAINDSFFIIPQNGQELATDTGEADGEPMSNYLSAIDGTGRESMFYGYYKDNKKTPKEDSNHLLSLCLLLKNNGIETLSTDYCSSKYKVDHSYSLNSKYGFIPFAADERGLFSIPKYPKPIFRENSQDIGSLSQAKNMLYIINGDGYNSKADFISAISNTNYDIVLIDLFFNESIFSQEDIASLKQKKNGGKRIVLCYMSIGEAEDYRYYWKDEWSSNSPLWIDRENPDWEGNYKVKYWNKTWQSIIYGNPNSYLNRIITQGFDGVYLDIIDGFEYFEEN